MPDYDETLVRIANEIAKRPNGRGREVSWLADKLQTTLQRINNWRTRGLPASALVDVASALGWSVNQVLGLAEPPAVWPFQTIDPQRFARLTERQAAMVELVVLRELERIESAVSASGKRLGNG